mmetsp:Transcript_11741/g.30781  ORF Transcript_11741/g.30781 Transcript_11741/m.30781 type:complete len:288 (+) Transcript_11741:344-1207(+)
MPPSIVPTPASRRRGLHGWKGSRRLKGWPLTDRLKLSARSGWRLTGARARSWTLSGEGSKHGSRSCSNSSKSSSSSSSREMNQTTSQRKRSLQALQGSRTSFLPCLTMSTIMARDGGLAVGPSKYPRTSLTRVLLLALHKAVPLQRLTMMQRRRRRRRGGASSSVKRKGQCSLTRGQMCSRLAAELRMAAVAVMPRFQARPRHCLRLFSSLYPRPACGWSLCAWSSQSLRLPTCRRGPSVRRSCVHTRPSWWTTSCWQTAKTWQTGSLSSLKTRVTRCTSRATTGVH